MGHESHYLARVQLSEVLHLTVDVAPYVISVVIFKPWHDMAPKNAVPEPWCEPFDLGLDPLGHVEG